jgi:hypothetical protein
MISQALQALPADEPPAPSPHKRSDQPATDQTHPPRCSTHLQDGQSGQERRGDSAGSPCMRGVLPCRLNGRPVPGRRPGSRQRRTAEGPPLSTGRGTSGVQVCVWGYSHGHPPMATRTMGGTETLEPTETLSRRASAHRPKSMASSRATRRHQSLHHAGGTKQQQRWVQCT